MTCKFWRDLTGVKVKQQTSTERAKRSRKQLDAFAKTMGLTIKDNWVGRRYGILNAEGNTIHNDYGVQDCPYTLHEVEQCLEDYKNNKPKN